MRAAAGASIAALEPSSSPCRCGARLKRHAYERLPLVETLDVGELAPLVVRWPDGVVV